VGHGTHVAGTIGAAGNNNLGVVGVNWRVKLLACKFINQFGGGDTSDVLECLEYVKLMKQRGVNIVATNNSWGGLFLPLVLQDAIREQQQAGILFIAAAGNEFSNNDVLPAYPASFFVPNVISVAATGRRDEKVLFSNFGRRTVHLGAPGHEILSTQPKDGYGFASGTSMATPHVTGVAALLKAQDANRDWRAIKNLVLAGGDEVSALNATLTGKRLNAHGALTCTDSAVSQRQRPIESATSAAVGEAVQLVVLNINCGAPGGAVNVGVQPGGTVVALSDDGLATDQAAGDGLYSGIWTPAAKGSYTLSFPDGDVVTVQVLDNYQAGRSETGYRAITGTSLDLDDDAVGTIDSPFPIRFGNGSFERLFVSSNGTISFTNAFGEFNNQPLPLNDSTAVTLVAPFWDDLYPIPGTGQNVFWQVTGTAPNRELVVEWRDVSHFECRSEAGATIKFQVVFQEGQSSFFTLYQDSTFGGDCAFLDNAASATIGVQVAAGVPFLVPGVGYLWSHFGRSVGDGWALLWQAFTTTPPPNPVPTLTALSPDSAEYYGPDFVLTVTGTNFVPNSYVYWGSFQGQRVTTYISATELRAVIPASDLDGFLGPTINVQVVNPGPGGGFSGPRTFTLRSRAPTITKLTPSTVAAGSFSFRLEVSGEDFVSGSVLRWNGADRLTSMYNRNRLVAAIPHSDVATPGTVQVTVVNPSGGGSSNSVALEVTPAASGFLQQPGLSLSSGAEPTPEPDMGPAAGRFLGWKHAREQGEEYLRRFLRPNARAARAPEKPDATALAASMQAFVEQPAPVGLGFAPSFPAGFIPTSTATGDFDRDGKTDWVVASGGTSELWFYFGDGAGGAQRITILPLAGVSPVWVAAADLRQNGIVDLIVAQADSGTVGVLLGRGDGTFAPQFDYFVPGAPVFLLVRDFTGDGKLDILAGLISLYTQSPFYLLPGDGTGAFSSTPVEPRILFTGTSFTFWMDAADVDHDGDLDLLIADLNSVSFSGGVISYLNDGSGNFKGTQQVFVNGFGNVNLGVGLADFNSDGCADAVSLYTFGLAFLFHGNCDGTFSASGTLAPFGQGEIAAAIQIADANADGKPDILATGFRAGKDPIFGVQSGELLSVLLGDGQGGFQRARVYRGGPNAFGMAVADLNGDSKLDVVTANQDADSASVFLNDGSGGYGPPSGLYVGHFAEGNFEGVVNSALGGVSPADVDGDSDPDLIILNVGRLFPEPYLAAVALNDGTGRFAGPVRSAIMEEDFFFTDYLLGDFRNSGRPDIVAIGLELSDSLIVFARNEGGGNFGPPKTIRWPRQLHTALPGDFDRDGKLDFVAAGHSENPQNGLQITFFRGNGDGSFQPGASLDWGGATAEFVGAVRATDINADGALDLLLFAGFRWYLAIGSGNGTFAAPTLLFEAHFSSFGFADFNNDGKVDMVELEFQDSATGRPVPPLFKIRLGRGDGTFALTATYGNFRDPVEVPYGGWTWKGARSPSGIADYNGDGNLDIAVFQRSAALPFQYSAYVQFLLGRGDGTFAPAYNDWRFFHRAIPMDAIDVNADGKADLVELDGYTASFHVIPATTGTSFRMALVSEPVIGSQGRLRITLNMAAASDKTIALSASDPAIQVPATATIPAGALAVDVPFQIGSAFDHRHMFEIRGTLGTEVEVVRGVKAAPNSGAGFTLFVSAETEVLLPGETGRALDVFAISVAGYETIVDFSCDAPAGIVCEFGQSQMVVDKRVSAVTTLTIRTAASLAAGNHPLTVVASDGVLLKGAQVLVRVGDFSVSITPAARNAAPNQSVPFVVSLPSVNEYRVGVVLNCSGLPAGASCSLQNRTLVVGDSLEFFVQTGNAPPGNHTFTVTADTGSATRTATAELRIMDVTATFSATSATVAVGQSASFNITLNGQNGFGGQVTLSCVNPPTGVACAFAPNPLALTENGSGSSQLTVTVNARPPSGLVQGLKGQPAKDLYAWVGALAALALGLVMVAVPPRRRTRLNRPVAWLLLFILTVLGGMACGGGGGGGGSTPRPQPTPQPPSVTVNLTIQASSAMLTKNVGTIAITVP
jgi:hypothetical protein